MPCKIVKCTCTLKWLQFYSDVFESFVYITSDYSLNYGNYYFLLNLENQFNFCDKHSTLECNFEEMFKDCLNDFQTTYQLNDMGVYMSIKNVQFILLTILEPIFCFTGLINNTLTIVLIKNKKKAKEMQDSMYKHIIINASFNIMCCLITAFKLINSCLFYD